MNYLLVYSFFFSMQVANIVPYIDQLQENVTEAKF